ncbi:MAG: SpoIIE family protein phosphatase [Desulfobacula sp.]|nr:SpoIIE family protein phosphatase [Desulfobacula sp.]
MMFRTIKGKIIFFVAMVMIVSTVINIYITKRDVGDAMLAAQEKSARNILHSLDLVLKDDYHNLLSAKRTMTLLKRTQLKNAARMIESVLTGFCGQGTNNPVQKRQIKHALEWLKTAPFKDINYYLMDKTSHVMVNSNETVTNQTYKSIEDIKHRKIAQVMRFENLKKKGDYAIFNMGEQGGSVLAYFLPFKPWEFTIAVSVDVSDIEAEALEKKTKIIASLDEYSKQLKITDNGFVFMMDEDSNILIAPPEYIKSQIHVITDRMKNNMAIEAIKSSASYAISEIRYSVVSKAGKKQTMVAYCSYFKPLKWYTSVVVPLNEINRPAQELVVRQSLIITLMFMVGLVVVFILVTRIATPLNLLAFYAKKLPELDFTKPLEEKSPIDDLPKKYKDEVGELASSFILMRQELSRNIQDLVKITASRQAIESELNIAREIQLGMVPKTFPSFPEYKEFDLYATLRPAKEIGGDLYDFFLIDKDHICFTLGDVSDKGIPAALFMVVTRTLIRTLSENEYSPAKMMVDINNTLSADNPRSMFVTLVIGILNINTGEIIYANGGHNPPIVIPDDENVYFIEGKKEPLVGAMPGMSYTDMTLTLLPGDSFFLYTDGVNEAMDPDEEQYSNEQLISQVSTQKDSSPAKIIESMLESIQAHTKTAPQSDDIAMLMIKYNG